MAMQNVGAHVRPLFPDERDGFISWLRGEFAAANAIIDSFCHHLGSISGPGEYDSVVACVQNRRSYWNHVLHMQQYFSIGEIAHALQQVELRKHHKYYDGKGNDFQEFGSRSLNRIESVTEIHNSPNELVSENVNKLNEGSQEFKNIVIAENKTGEIPDDVAKTYASTSFKNAGSTERTISSNIDIEVTKEDSILDSANQTQPKVFENILQSIQSQNGKQNNSSIPKTFVATEIVDGVMVNVVDGLKLYEKLYDDLEVSKLVSLAGDLRAAGKRGQLLGSTFVAFKRPMKGHGREMIQLGIPVADLSSEHQNSDHKIEPIPALLRDVVEKIGATHAMSVKPDSCIIHFYNEGDHSQPHMWPSCYGRPICLLILTECDLTFGKVLLSNHPGDYKGSFKLSIAPGSLLVMHGKSTDLAKHALPSIPKQRMLVTFTKSHRKKTSHSVVIPQWGMLPSWSVNKCIPVLPPGMLLPPANGTQMINLVTSPVAPFQSPRLPIPGTGVFLPLAEANLKLLGSHADKEIGPKETDIKVEMKEENESTDTKVAVKQKDVKE